MNKQEKYAKGTNKINFTFHEEAFYITAFNLIYIKEMCVKYIVFLNGDSDTMAVNLREYVFLFFSSACSQ